MKIYWEFVDGEHREMVIIEKKEWDAVVSTLKRHTQEFKSIENMQDKLEGWVDKLIAELREKEKNNAL